MVRGLVDILRKLVNMSFNEMCRLGLGIWKCPVFRNYREVRKKESGGMNENDRRMSPVFCILSRVERGRVSKGQENTVKKKPDKDTRSQLEWHIKEERKFGAVDSD